MDIPEFPLEGYYPGGKHVTLKGKQIQNELRYLGCFGSDLQEAKRRAVAQRGGSTSDRHQSSSSNLPIDEATTILTLHEAFFLAHALGCLNIKNAEGKLMDLTGCWNSFKEYHKRLSKEYAVYFYFRTRGWIVKDGNNYGVTFLLYKHSPTIDHARYGVMICDASQTFQSLLTFHRVIQSVKKELLLVFLTTPTNSEINLDQIGPDNLKEISITTRVFKTYPNFIPKKQLTTEQGNLNVEGDNCTKS